MEKKKIDVITYEIEVISAEGVVDIYKCISGYYKECRKYSGYAN